MEEQSIILIQRIFRTKQIHKAIKILNYSKEIVKNYTFEEFTKKIQDKKVLSLVNYILTKINSICNYGKSKILTSQEFLSAFVIYGYENDIFMSCVRNFEYNINKILIDICQKVVEDFDIFFYKIERRDVYSFNKCLNEYKIIFDSWKTDDKSKLIEMLSNTYYEINEIINEINNQYKNNKNLEEEYNDEKSEFIELCKERKKDIVNKILYLDTDYGKDFLNKYNPENIVLDDKFEQYIKETVHNIFWDSLYDELNENPPKFEKLLSLLKELKEDLCNMVPNRKDIHKDIDDKIDIDLINNMLINNAFDDETLKKLIIYIISLIKQFQPPAMDKDIDIWESKLLNKFNEKFEYADFLVVFLRSIFNILEQIKIYAKKFIEEMNI